jgi:hypothetical protein
MPCASNRHAWVELLNDVRPTSYVSRRSRRENNQLPVTSDQPFVATDQIAVTSHLSYLFPNVMLRPELVP